MTREVATPPAPDRVQTSTTTDGFHLVVDALKLNGIDTIYGVAGIPITDLARLAQAEGIRYIGFRHEESAGNAAAISGSQCKRQPHELFNGLSSRARLSRRQTRNLRRQ